MRVEAINFQEVMENAYLRALLRGTGKQVQGMSSAQRSTALQPFRQAIRADVTYLREAFVYYSLSAQEQARAEALQETTLREVVMDTEQERESEG